MRILLFLPILFFCCQDDKLQTETKCTKPTNFYLGADLSYVNTIEKNGGQYFDNIY